jgi:hypothetical protein
MYLLGNWTYFEEYRFLGSDAVWVLNIDVSEECMASIFWTETFFFIATAVKTSNLTYGPILVVRSKRVGLRPGKPLSLSIGSPIKKFISSTPKYNA